MDPTFMRDAIRLSLRAIKRGSGGPFGAVIVQGRRVVGRGWNCVTSTNDPTAHAEVLAIRRACVRLRTFRLDDCDLYTSCEPCPMCLAAIYWARIRTVYFGNTRRDAASIGFDDDLIYREIARPASRRRLHMRQLLRSEALAAFDQWEQVPGKILY
jgi:guanine deaminase